MSWISIVGLALLGATGFFIAGFVVGVKALDEKIHKTQERRAQEKHDGVHES